MVRIALVIGIWACIVCGMVFYMQRGNPGLHRELAGIEQQRSTIPLQVEITTTSLLQPDPYALVTNGLQEAACLLVRLDGKEILRNTSIVPAGISVCLNTVPPLNAGLNEFYIEASAPIEKARKNFAVRIRLMQRDQVLAEKTVWSEMPSRIAGTFRIIYEPEKNAISSHGT